MTERVTELVEKGKGLKRLVHGGEYRHECTKPVKTKNEK